MAHTIETCDECTGLWEEDSDPVVILCPLHAAAPMLLEACKLILADAEEFVAHIGSVHANRLRAAISLAEGK